MTAGIVSARGRNIGACPYDDFIQIDAAINQSNSGGPSFNLDGCRRREHRHLLAVRRQCRHAFAIPADTVNTVVGRLKGGSETVTRGWIGVQIQPATAEIAENLGLRNPRGALVADVQPNSPALRAGIRAGAVIASVNGESLHDSRSLARRIGAMAPGTSVRLAVIRSGREETFTLTLGELPRERQANQNR